MKLLDTIDGSYRLYFSGENHTYQTSNLKLELKLLKYFHQNHGVNTLLLEFGNVTGWLVNEYIVTGEEKLEKALKINFSKNFVNYFKEIKKYNDSLPKADRIKVVGIDVQRSVQIGFEMMNYLLPPDSILPEDSISQQIELIRSPSGLR